MGRDAQYYEDPKHGQSVRLSYSDNRISTFCLHVPLVFAVYRQSVVETRRDGSWVALQSGGLIHGDIITLDDNQVVPADVVIVSGECVVDEAQLTGESTPVR